MPMSISEDRLHQDTVAIRNEELRTLWLVNGFFSTINTALIGFIFLRTPSLILTLVICLFGLMVCGVWYATVERIWLWLSYWNRSLVRQEIDLPEPKKIFGGERYDSESSRGVSVSGVIKFFILYLSFGWAMGFILAALGIIKL